MDIVETLRRKGPILVTILDFELQIRWDPGGLDGRDVGTDNLAAWELVGKVTISLEQTNVMCVASLTLPKFLFRSQCPEPFGCLCQAELDAIRRLEPG